MVRSPNDASVGISSSSPGVGVTRSVNSGGCVTSFPEVAYSSIAALPPAVLLAFARFWKKSSCLL